MKTGNRLWFMLALVGLILFGYALAELHDAAEARQAEVAAARALLARERELVGDRQWPKRQRDIKKLRALWQAYLPVEESPALARANLLGALRNTAQAAGLLGVSVAAPESDASDANAPPSVAASRSAAKSNVGLPAGVQMTKLQISSRFEPGGFVKMVRALEQGGHFMKIDTVTVRASQLEIGVRAYWQIRPASQPPKQSKQTVPSASAGSASVGSTSVGSTSVGSTAAGARSAVSPAAVSPSVASTSAVSTFAASKK